MKTFTIGFSEKEYDEATYAKKVAAHLGTDHTELYVTPEEARAVIPLCPKSMTSRLRILRRYRHTWFQSSPGGMSR